MLNKNFRDFLRLLIENDVRFVVVGGYAVGIHGFPRYTGDLDVFVDLDATNAARIVAVFHAFGERSTSGEGREWHIVRQVERHEAPVSRRNDMFTRHGQPRTMTRISCN